MKLLALLFLSLTLSAAPVLAREVAQKPVAAKQTPVRGAKPATKAELQSYAEREKASKELEKFEGGRLTEVTLIVILLLVIIIVILV